MKQTISLRTTESHVLTFLFCCKQQVDESQIDNESVQDRNLAFRTGRNSVVATFADRQLGVSQLLFYFEL
jgi:hypothetical protein